jgi:transposase
VPLAGGPVATPSNASSNEMPGAAPPRSNAPMSGRHGRSGEIAARPPAFDEEIYTQHNTMERAFNRLKQWRGIATRYDKYALTFLGGVLLAATIMTARTASRN